MTNKQKAKMRRQRTLNKQFALIACVNILIILAIIFIASIKSVEVSGNNEIEDESTHPVHESETIDHNTETSSANASNDVTTVPETTVPETTIKFSRNLSDEDKYLLAKMAMAEAEGESIETKIYVILTILNRVDSEDRYFPDTIEEVLFQNNGGVYQFSPVAPGGRWWRVEPNEECWEAVEIVNGMEEDVSMGALYFESCTGESWHSRNLEFLFKSDNMRFYK